MRGAIAIWLFYRPRSGSHVLQHEEPMWRSILSEPDRALPYRDERAARRRGGLRVLFEGGTEVLTPIDPSMTLQGIADAVTGSARDKGIDAAEYGTASVVFNPH